MDPLSDFINGRTEGNILNSQALLSAYEQVFSVQDNKCEFTQKLHLWSIHPLEAIKSEIGSMYENKV